MKTLTSASLTKQNDTGIVPEAIDRVILYEQWTGKITEVTDSDTIKVAGDATSFFADNDYCLFPLRDFETEYQINGSPSHSAGETTIDFDGSPAFTGADVGQIICLKRDITLRLIEDGIGEGLFAIEGINLHEFDSGEMPITVDNNDSYFYERNGNGIFNSGNPQWAKYLTGFKGEDDNIIWFGGEVDLSELEPDLYNKELTFKIYGHSRSLENVPATRVSDVTQTELLKIPGFEIDSFTESDNTEDGIKKLEYKPFGGTLATPTVSVESQKLKGVQVVSVSEDTLTGVYVLEFRHPYYFRWNNGTEYQIKSTADLDDADAGTIQMLSKDGVRFAIVKFGDSQSLNSFPDEDTEMWVAVKQENISRQVGEQGTPSMRFDNGPPETIKLHFPRILDFDDSGGTYTEVETSLNSIEVGVNATVLAANSDELWIIASERFFGFEIFFDTPFNTATVNFKYSTGGNTFSSAMTSVDNGLSDGTSALTQDGKIIWTSAENWRVGTLVIDTSTEYNGFIIKITRTAATGSCIINEIRRLLRLRGQNDDILTLKTIQSKIQAIESDDEVIIRREKDNTFSVAVWYQNVALQQILEKALDEGDFGSGKRSIADMKASLSSARFNIWGRPPKINYPFETNGILIDGTNEYVYVGIGLELWRASFQSGWSKLADLSSYITDTESIYVITDVIKDSTDIYMLIQRDINDINGDSGWFLNTKAWAFSYKIATTIVTQHNSPSRVFEPMFRSMRIGKRFGTYPYHERLIGQDDPNMQYAGENICIPFKQIVSIENLDNQNFPSKAQSLDENDLTGGQYFIFRDPAAVSNFGHGQFYNIDMGIYFYGDASIDANPNEIYAWLDYGNQGCILKAADLTDFFMITQTTDADAATCYEFLGVKGGATTFALAAWYRRESMPICVARKSSTQTLYFGFTQWHDDEQDSKSYSYVTEWDKDKVHDWDQVWKVDVTGPVITDITSDVNAQTTVSDVVTEIGDIIYFGLNEKFRGLHLVGLGATYAFEYWDGSSWTALSDAPASLTDERLVFSIPRNWAKTTVNGSASLYYVRLRVTAISSNDDLTTGFCMERVLWDSQTWAEGGETAERYMPIALEYNPNEDTLHGVMYNRENDSGESFPFQWEYFVIDLSDDTFHTFNLTGDGTASGFNYDGSLLPKHLLYNSGNNKVWFAFENIRYKDTAMFVCTAEYSGGAITLTKIGIPIPQDYGSKVPFSIDDVTGNIFGISKGTRNRLWEYGTIFWPRIEVARFDEKDTVKDVLSYIAEVSINHWMIHSERTFRMVKRGSSNGSFTLEWDKNMINSKPGLPYWKHYYDAVRCDFEGFVDENESGSVKTGLTGFQKKIMDISNPLIQNIHLAKLVQDEAYSFFNNYRLNPVQIMCSYLIQLELLDKFVIAAPSDILDILSSIYFVIEKIKLNPSKRQIELEGIEII